jgi:hypothetical protein
MKGRETTKKKESGDSSENGICSCGLLAHCCQPAVAGGIIYADLWGELSTHLALQALFAPSSPVREPLLQAFPFPSTLGKVTLHPHCQGCVFIYSSCGRWVFPPILCSFSPTATFTSFPAPDYWAVLLLLPAAMFVYSSREKWVLPPLLWSFPPSATLTSFPAPGCWALPPSLARPGLFIYSPGKDSLPPIFGAQCTPPSFLHVFFALIAYYSVSLFSLGGGQSVPGAMLLWPRLVCGSTAVLRSSPGPRLPMPSGRWWLVARGPSLFLHLTWSGDSLHRLEVWMGQSYASSQWLCLQSVSLASLQDFTIGGSLSASSF